MRDWLGTTICKASDAFPSLSDSDMEDYIRGILCGYMTVQHGVRDDARKKRMFLVLTDSRLDYYDTDPRPSFEQNIADAYIFSASTRVHFYVEINARAPPHSLCVTTDKASCVYIAESDAEAQTWFRHLHERLEALATMVTGTLVLRKEISVHHQLKRLLLHTKYKWKSRYIELGRSSLHFCKASEKKTKMMKQFPLSAQSFVGEEGVEFLKQHRVLASYATAIVPDAKLLAKFKKETREQHYNPQQQQPMKLKRGKIAAAYPFVVATGQTHLFLAAPSESARADWITAIRMRIISLKYRHNGDKKTKSDENSEFQLRGFMEVQMKPGCEWKKHFVEIDNDIVRVKASERKVGAKFETRLIPTCHVAPTLLKANAFVLRSLGREIALAPGSMKEAERWMAILLKSARATSLVKCQKMFEDDVRVLLSHSVVYNLVVPAGEQVGLVVERYKKRIVVLSHQPPQLNEPGLGSQPFSRDSKTGSFSQSLSLKRATSSHAQLIPQGSVLVAISQFEMAHESFENIWHKLRHKKGYSHPMTLTFRAPAMKRGIAGVKFRTRDPWVVCRCSLQHGKLSIASMDKTDSSNDTVLADLPLRHCQVELFGAEADCKDGIKITVTGTNSSALATTVLLNIAGDHDCFLWFALLHLESAIAQDDSRYPLSVAALVNSKSSKKPHLLGVAEDQRRCFQQCSVAGMRVEEIEKVALIKDPLLGLSVSDTGGNQSNGISSEAVQMGFGGGGGTGTSRQLSESDSTAFFQLLDAIGCGKVSSSSLVRSMEALTRHIVRQEGSKTQGVGTQVGEPAHQGVLAAFYVALETLNLNRQETSFSIDMGDFVLLMKSVTDAEVVELVQKMARHDIQCM